MSGEEPLSDQALVTIGESQEAGRLFVSPISAWELAVATRKGRTAGRPNLGEVPPGQWFREAAAAIDAKIIPIRQRIACEAAEVIIATGHRDPGDCFLMATARIRRLTLVTRDDLIRRISVEIPNYVDVLIC